MFEVEIQNWFDSQQVQFPTIGPSQLLLGILSTLCNLMKLLIQRWFAMVIKIEVAIAFLLIVDAQC